MKRLFGVIFILVVALFVGCDLNTLTYEDMLGEWDFPDGSHVSVMTDSSDASIKKLDIDFFDPSTTEYFCYGDGTANGNTYTGTYNYNKNDVTDPSNPVFIASGSNIAITITLSLQNNMLKVVCTGPSPLGGHTFTSGTK